MCSEMKVIFISIIYIVLVQRCVIGFHRPHGYKVEQLKVLFRHGDRTLVEGEIYTTDPYANLHRDYGYGLLTEAGKKRAYKIGQLLRELYGSFLDDHLKKKVYAYSTDADRTKTTLEFVLAGLYSPKTSNDSVDWQQIPIHYDSIANNFMTAGYFCPTYQKQFIQVARSPDSLQSIRKYRRFIQYLQEATNINFTTFLHPVNLHTNLHVVSSLGLPLPAWCSRQDFHKLQKITSLTYKALTRTERMKRIIVGPIIEEFLKKDVDDKKVYLYSGHDVNIQGFIDTHNISGVPMLQDFGSALIFEKLRGRDDRIYVHMYLWTGVMEKLISLKLPNCDRICPLSDYTSIVQSMRMDDSSMRECMSNSNALYRKSEWMDIQYSDLNEQLAILFAD